MQLVLENIYEVVKLAFDNFISPGKRINVLYLFTSLILALYVFLKAKPRISFLNYILNKKVWLSLSARVDYSLFFINGLLKIFLIAPILIIGVYLQEFVSGGLTTLVGNFSLEISRFSLVVIYTLVLWLVDDFAGFYMHYLMHKIPFLWRFHKIHHSATTLNPITQYRIHPGELFLNSLKEIIVFGVITGLFYFLAGGKIGIMSFLGVNILRFFFLAIGSNLRHSHVKLTFPVWIERIIISPFQHQIHHSDKDVHYNKNLGSHLAIWDRIFGTLLTSKDVNKIRFGLGAQENKENRTLLDNLIAPIRKENNK